MSSTHLLASIFIEIYHRNHKTQKRIRFYGNPFGVSYKGIRQVFGKPNYLQQKGLTLKKQKTVFYKLNIKGIKCLLQMHLYEDQMFFAQIQLRDANSRMRDEFLRLFQMKYDAKSLQWGETIEDEHGNKIAHKDDVVPKASFFSGDQKVWKKITDDLDDIAFRESFTHFSLKNTALRWS